MDGLAGMELRICRWATLTTLIAGFTLRATGGPFQLISTLDPAQAPPAGGGGDSYAPIISPDGRFVLFASTANNLVLSSVGVPFPLLLPPRLNVLLRDRSNRTTTLVSGNLAGTGGGDGDSWPTGLSADGRYALFESTAGDLVPSDTNNAADVFIRDVAVGTTALVSVSTNGGAANGASRGSVMTPDRRYVAFTSEASNLVAQDTNDIADVFVRDLQFGLTTLVSVGANSSGIPGAGGSESPDITPDGRYVAFYSEATNLVTGVTNSGDVYLHDLMGGTTTWVSRDVRTVVQSAPGANNAVSYNYILSADGQFVAYQASPVPGAGWVPAGVVLRYSVTSDSTDVVNTNATVRTGAPEDFGSLDMTPDGRFIAFVANTNGTPGTNSCVCVWDAQTGNTTLASGDLSNNVPDNSICDSPVLDQSGRFVVFLSSASNSVTNWLLGGYHVYLRDTQAGVTTLVDCDTNGAGAGVGPGSIAAMTPDARFVAFECLDASLAPNDRNHDYDVFVHELAAGTNDLISARHPSLPTLSGNGPSLLSTFSVSTDGVYVAFASEADNLTPGDTNGYRDIFLCNLLAGTNFLVSVGTNGVAADGPSTDPAISGNGRYVAFTSSADNLAPGDRNKAQDVYVRDLQAGSTVLVSVNSAGSGSGNGASYSPTISADGRYVLFRSVAQNLAAGPFTAGYENLFLRDLQAGTTYALTHTTFAGPAGAMTPDGRFVAFSGIIPGNSAKLYVWDSQAASLIYTNAVSGIVNLAVSPDGNRIAYSTSSTLSAVDRVASTSWTIGSLAPISHPGMRFSADGRFLVYAARTSSTNQVCLYDLQYGTNFLVSHSYNSPGGAYGASDWPEISSDGRFVAYRSAAPNIVVGDANGIPDLFLCDRVNNSTTLLSLNRFGTAPGDNRSLAPVFSGDAQTLLFQSWASDVVSQDFNQSGDLFAYRLFASGQIPLFSASISRGIGRGPWITWPAIPGKTYHVQSKNNLNDQRWQDVSRDVTIIGNQAYFNDLTAGSGPSFYRVVAF
jgi:Tol biopolymer transport system component